MLCKFCGEETGTRVFCNPKCTTAWHFAEVKKGNIPPDVIDDCPECEEGKIPRWKRCSSSMRQKTCKAPACKKRSRDRTSALTRARKARGKATTTLAPGALTGSDNVKDKRFRTSYCNQKGACLYYPKCSDLLSKAWPRELGLDCFQEDVNRGRLTRASGPAYCLHES